MDLKTTQSLSLDFHNNEIKIIRAKQYDKKSRYLLIKCTDKGSPYLLDKATMKCNFKMSTPDNRGIYNNTIIQDDGTVLVELTETSLLEAGMCDAELDIIDLENEALLSTMCFNILIEKSAYSNDIIEKSNEFNALTKMVTEEKSRYDSMTELEETVSANEEIRIANENTRISNEGNRVSAENDRITDTATAITNANNATTNANNATANAETATEAAQEATNNANIATQQANTVIEKMKSLIADDNVVHVEDKGIANGVATLDENGNIPSSQLPSYVDDVLDGSYDSDNDRFLDLDGNVYTPESGKIYIDVEKRITYRWSGSTYVDIGSSLTLGTNSSTAFPGDRGLTLEEKVAAIEAYHNNIPASDIKFDNTSTPLLGANVQTAIENLTKTATQTKDGLLSASDKVLIDNYANIQEIEVTLSASRWVGSAAPYTQIITLSDLISYNSCSIELNPNATVIQETAITDAIISNITYDETIGLTFTASGEKPTVDIPIIICVGTSMNVVGIPTYLDNLNEASAISYNNTTSGLTSSDVQSVIDELDNTIDNLNTNKANTSIVGSDTLTTTAKTCTGAINELNNNKAPLNHASVGEEYGVASDTEYGHVMLYDDYTFYIGGGKETRALSVNGAFRMYQELSTKCEVTTSKPTLINSSFQFLGIPVIVKNGGMAILAACVRTTAAYTKGTKVIQIPSECRGTINNCACIVGGENSGVTGATSDENGKISFTSDLITGTYVQLIIPYKVS